MKGTQGGRAVHSTPTGAPLPSPTWCMEALQQALPFADPLAALVRDNADQFRADFLAWLAENRAVWAGFKREADRIWHRGRTHYSARTIIEHLRHESALTDNDAMFKLNNNHAPDLARLYRLAHPERAGLFETRVMPGSRRAA